MPSESWPGGYPGPREVPNIDTTLTVEERRQILAPFRARVFRIAYRAGWLFLGGLLFAAFQIGLDLFDRRIVWPVLAFAATWGAIRLVDWDDALRRAGGEAILGMATVVLIAAISMVSAIRELRPLVFVTFFGVVVVTAALGGRLFHAATTFALIVANVVIPTAFGGGVSAEQLIVESATLVLVAMVSGRVAIEFRRETYEGVVRLAEIARREEDVARLYEVSRTMSAGDNLREVLPALVGRIARYLDAQVGVVLLHDPADRSLAVVSPIWTVGHDLTVGDYRVPLDDPDVLCEVFRTRQTMLIEDTASEPVAPGLLGELGVDSALAVTLIVEKRAIGVLVIGDKRSGPFTEDDAAVLESLSAPAALVLAQLERYEEAAETSRRMGELAQLKTDFVSVVSHELRTPLTSIIGSLDTVSRPELAPKEPAARELIAAARSQSHRLRRLIEDLLMVSQLDNDALPQNAERIRLLRFLGDTVAGIPGTYGLVTVEAEDGLTVHADPDHLSRIVRNLVENALKYAPGSPVELAAADQGNFVAITFSDHGPGIPVDQRALAFERFRQLDAPATRTRGGTGLGLSIVRSLSEAMGGSVDLSDTPGGGATFTVWLPQRPGFVTKPPGSSDRARPSPLGGLAPPDPVAADRARAAEEAV